MDRTEEMDLARKARAGSVMAFGGLVTLHHQRVFAFLLALTRHRQDAEDLTQDTFLRAWAKFHRYDPTLPMLPWLFTIARRLSIAALRRNRPVPGEAAAPAAPPTPDDRALWMWESARAILSPDAYTALWLHYREELAIKEIASILKKREGAIKVMLHRARASLAEKLQATPTDSHESNALHPQRQMP